MNLQDIQAFLGIATSTLTILGIPVAAFLFWQKIQQSDGNKITNTEKADLTLAAKIDVISLEMRHLTEAFLLIKQNDLHTITEKQRDQDSQIGKCTVAIEKLATIIDERVPRKTIESIN